MYAAELREDESGDTDAPIGDTTVRPFGGGDDSGATGGGSPAEVNRALAHWADADEAILAPPVPAATSEAQLDDEAAQRKAAIAGVIAARTAEAEARVSADEEPAVAVDLAVAREEMEVTQAYVRARADLERRFHEQRVKLEAAASQQSTSFNRTWNAAHSGLLEEDRSGSQALRVQAADEHFRSHDEWKGLNNDLQEQTAGLKGSAESLAAPIEAKGQADARAIRETGDGRAEAARASGESHARQALAEARRSADAAADPAEKRRILAQGQQRVVLARSQALRTETQIRAQAIARAEETLAKARESAERVREGGRSRVDDLRFGPIKAVDKKRDADKKELRDLAAGGAGELFSIRIDADYEMGTLDAGSAKQALAALEKQRTEAEEKLGAEHERRLADVKRQGKRARGADADDLTDRLERLDHVSDQAETASGALVRRAGKRAARKSKRGVRLILARGKAAERRVDAITAAARRDMQKSVVKTGKAMHARGGELEAETAALARDKREEQRQQAAMGGADLIALAAVQTAERGGDLEHALNEGMITWAGELTSDRITTAWADSAAAAVGRELRGPSAFLGEDEAEVALDTMLTLPDDALGGALYRLDDEQLHKLVSRLPGHRRAELRRLFAQERDPARKAILMRHTLTGEAWDQAMQGDPSQVFDRLAIARTTEQELALETMDLLTDPALDVATVDAVEARKRREGEVEMKHGVNLTNDHPLFGKPKAVWDNVADPSGANADNLLDHVDASLSRVGPRDLRNVREIHRAQHDFDEAGNPNLGVRGDSLHGRINVYDASLVRGTNGKKSGPSVLGDHQAGGAAGHDEMTGIDQTIVHEIGHVLDEYDEHRFDGFREGADWSNEGPRGLDFSQGVDFWGRKNQLTTDGRVYNANPYGQGAVSHDEGRVPRGGDYWYARTNEKDDVADTYGFALNKPEETYADLVGTPRVMTEMAGLQRDAAWAAAKAAGGSNIGLTWDALVAEGAYEEAEADQAGLLAKRDNLRAGNFGHPLLVDTQIALSAAKVRARAGEAEAEHFRDEAEKVFTPQQLEALEAQFPARSAP